MNDSTKTEPLAMRPQQAAKALGISARHLWQLTKDGEIRSVRAGQSVLYPILELQRWLAPKQDEGALMKNTTANDSALNPAGCPASMPKYPTLGDTNANTRGGGAL